MKNPKFIIKKRDNKQYMFNLIAPNGEIILTSEGYTTKDSCLNGISSVKINSTIDNMYDKKEGQTYHNQKNHYKVPIYYWFNLVAKNGEIIGTSEMYTTAEGRDNGIKAVQNYSNISPIKDKTRSWLYNFFS